MKYYIGEIETYIKESMISTIVKFKTDIDPDLYLDALASDFWGEANKPEDGELYDFGDKKAGSGNWQQVDVKTYNKLTVIFELIVGKK